MTGPSRDVLLVVDFLNTLNVDDDTDALGQAETWRRWAGDRALTPDTLHVARSAREALRAAVGDPVARAAPLVVPVQIELTASAPTLSAPGAVGAVLAAATRLAVLGDWGRVKICPAEDCRWAFFDQSRNRSRSWCSMRVCGNRQKARTWRERQ